MINKERMKHTMKKIYSFILILLLLIALTACSKTKPIEDPPIANTPDKPPVVVVEDPKPNPALVSYPRVDGSTATIPLSEAFAAAYTKTTLEEARPYVLHNQTHAAYENLINNKADIIFVTSPSEGELQMAKEHKVELEVVPIVSEGFVFLVHANNPIKALSLDQIQDIYTGKVTNWAELGGSNVPIIAYQRPVNSGSQTGFLDLVMKGKEPTKPPTDKVIGMMGALIDAVAAYKNTPDAIGYSYYYFVIDMWGNQNIKLLEVDGVYPDKTTISSGLYPLKTAYYAVLRSDEPTDSPARKLLTWILSDEGQEVAEDAGYVKVR